MLKPFKFLLIVILTISLGSVALAQDTEPSGNIVVWMQRANQDQIENTVLPAFYEAYPNITVEFVNYSPNEVGQNLALAIQGGAGAPDVALMENNQIPRIVDLGGVMDVTDLIADDMADFNASVLQMGVRDGRNYSIPWDVGPVVMFYRRDIFEAAGLPSDPDSVSELVATWDGYFTVCETIKAETGLPCFASNRANNIGELWMSVLWSQGLGWWDDENRLTVNDAPQVEALELLGRFWDADLVSDDLEWTDGWYASLNETALEGGVVQPVASLISGGWMGGFLKNWAAPDTAGLWGGVPMPAVEAGGTRAANLGGSSYTIPLQSTNPEAAWAFINFVNSTESQIALLEYGDIFPARASTYDDPLFSEPDAYFADQFVREVYAEAALNTPLANLIGINGIFIGNTTDVAVQQYATGQATAQEALDAATETIRLETGME
jgi:lactose/L-arabinose transport system substrate-binding protein